MFKVISLFLICSFLLACGNRGNRGNREEIKKYYRILRRSSPEEKKQLLELLKKSEPEIFKPLNQAEELTKQFGELVDQLVKTTNKTDCEKLQAQIKKMGDDIDIIIEGKTVTRYGGILVFPCTETGLDRSNPHGMRDGLNANRE